MATDFCLALLLRRYSQGTSPSVRMVRRQRSTLHLCLPQPLVLRMTSDGAPDNRWGLSGAFFRWANGVLYWHSVMTLP
jgi:hypothetical protein